MIAINSAILEQFPDDVVAHNRLGRAYEALVAMSLRLLYYIPNTVESGHRGDDVVEEWGTLDYSTEPARLGEAHGTGRLDSACASPP
ncbi:MAG TPA: hypothetical protein VHV75_11430 [Solirubrobacteraceae bacterium]|jgi:hypothetical protein|nr:hypothetical protein [Solirubrobacteraceae bacterium]